MPREIPAARIDDLLARINARLAADRAKLPVRPQWLHSRPVKPQRA